MWSLRWWRTRGTGVSAIRDQTNCWTTSVAHPATAMPVKLMSSCAALPRIVPVLRNARPIAMLKPRDRRHRDKDADQSARALRCDGEDASDACDQGNDEAPFCRGVDELCAWMWLGQDVDGDPAEHPPQQDGDRCHGDCDRVADGDGPQRLTQQRRPFPNEARPRAATAPNSGPSTIAAMTRICESRTMAMDAKSVARIMKETNDHVSFESSYEFWTTSAHTTASEPSPGRVPRHRR